MHYKCGGPIMPPIHAYIFEWRHDVLKAPIGCLESGLHGMLIISLVISSFLWRLSMIVLVPWSSIRVGGCWGFDYNRLLGFYIFEERTWTELVSLIRSIWPNNFAKINAFFWCEIGPTMHWLRYMSFCKLYSFFRSIKQMILHTHTKVQKADVLGLSLANVEIVYIFRITQFWFPTHFFGFTWVPHWWVQKTELGFLFYFEFIHF